MNLVDALSGTPYFGKLRTGALEAHPYPDEVELGAARVDTTRTGASVKASACLHHAVRSTDHEIDTSRPGSST